MFQTLKKAGVDGNTKKKIHFYDFIYHHSCWIFISNKKKIEMNVMPLK